jgi:hypothetical protein
MNRWKKSFFFKKFFGLKRKTQKERFYQKIFKFCKTKREKKEGDLWFRFPKKCFCCFAGKKFHWIFFCFFPKRKIIREKNLNFIICSKRFQTDTQRDKRTE